MNREIEKNKTVLAFGFFDGIHIGHAALLERAKARAAEIGASPAVLTFDAHPDTFVQGRAVPLLCSAQDRNYILHRFFGIDQVFYIHFNADTMRMEWKEFIEKIIARYAVAHFVVGYDFRFGNQGLGTAELLMEYCKEHGIGCDVVPQVICGGVTVSSTYIRTLVLDGEIEKANDLLGHPHLLTDIVRNGFRLGRTMDFPTVNMRFEDGVLVPRRGVYASRVMLPEGLRGAITNIGVRPTFGGDRVTVETHIYDYNADLYGHRLCVELHAFLRPEQAFGSLELLREQIQRDVEHAREYFKRR